MSLITRALLALAGLTGLLGVPQAPTPVQEDGLQRLAQDFEGELELFEERVALRAAAEEAARARAEAEAALEALAEQVALLSLVEDDLRGALASLERAAGEAG